MYNLKVTAINVAGESHPTLEQIKVGEPPSSPLYPTMTSITPDELTVEWDHPLDDGCLPVLHYVISRDAVDLDETVAPDLNSFTDDISSTADFPLGTLITYEIKAVNHAGASLYSEPLVVTVGQAPNPPTDLEISRRISETSVEIQWEADVYIANNLPTTSYLVYLDDLSGNEVEPYSVSSPETTLSGLELGHSYQVSVSAVNLIGEGATSSPAFDVHTGVVPSKMIGSSAPQLDSSTSTSITIKWLPPTYNGGASLSEYRVYHDIG